MEKAQRLRAKIRVLERSADDAEAHANFHRPSAGATVLMGRSGLSSAQ
jgi:hypothetical protein